MQTDERDCAKQLIFRLARALQAAGRDEDVLDAFFSAYPFEAHQHLAALKGDREAAAITLNTRWPYGGGSALSEYALGDRDAVLAGIRVTGHFLKPTEGSRDP